MNAKEAVVIDGVLKEVGDRLFYDPVRPLKNTVNINVKGLPARPRLLAIPILRQRSQAARTKALLNRTVRKVPEVKVKISGGGKSLMQIKAHLDYVSRNGDVALEDENGDLYQGKEAVRDLRDEWQFGRMPMSRESNVKQAFNIVLSMPPGTDRGAVTAAARDFARAEFGNNYSYVFATHDDEKHPHVHLCVKALGKDGIRLNPRKADLQRWREIFADKLLDHGIEANATKRPVRGITRKPRKQQAVHMERRGIKTKNLVGQQQAVLDEVRNGNPLPNPYKAQIDQTRHEVQTRLIQAGQTLAQSLQPEDRRLSKAVLDHAKEMPPTLSARELAVQAVKDQLERGRTVSLEKRKNIENGKKNK